MAYTINLWSEIVVVVVVGVGVKVISVTNPHLMIGLSGTFVVWQI